LLFILFDSGLTFLVFFRDSSRLFLILSDSFLFPSTFFRCFSCSMVMSQVHVISLVINQSESRTQTDDFLPDQRMRTIIFEFMRYFSCSPVGLRSPPRDYFPRLLPAPVLPSIANL
jgi:hypothetical protein